MAKWQRIINNKRIKRNDIIYIRHFFDNLAEILRLKSQDDWYGIGINDIIRHGGSSFISRNNESNLYSILEKIYPDKEWQVWRFRTVPTGYWDNFDNHRIFFDWLADQLNIDVPDKWYNISDKDIVDHGGETLLYDYYDGSLINTLMSIYPGKLN